jgi:hypothetical protein
VLPAPTPAVRGQRKLPLRTGSPSHVLIDGQSVAAFPVRMPGADAADDQQLYGYAHGVTVTMPPEPRGQVPKILFRMNAGAHHRRQPEEARWNGTGCSSARHAHGPSTRTAAAGARNSCRS